MSEHASNYFGEKPAVLAEWTLEAHGWLMKQVAVNYLFWYPAFVFVNWVNYLFIDKLKDVIEELVTRVYLVAVLHVLIVFLALACCEALVERAKLRFIREFCAALCFLAVGSFYLDFLLYRIVSMHLGKTLRILFEDGIAQFMLTMRATGLNAHTVAGLFFALTALTLAGAWLVRVAHRLSLRAPLNVALWQLLVLILALYAGALVLDFSERQWNNSDRVWREHRRVMPLHIGFWRPPGGLQFKGARLPALRELDGTNLRINKVEGPMPNNPDVFVFVLESFRGDYVNERTTPNLVRFRSECLPFRDALSSGNATHVSWYSLFTANYPLYISMTRLKSEMYGSVPMRLLCRMGYRINALAANDLNYYRSAQVIFGPNLEFASSITDSKEMAHLDPPGLDRHITELLLKKLEEPPGSRMFLMFFESTHHPYEWPPDMPAKFQPYAESWDYSRQMSERELALVKNRYRNAVFFLDDLIGQILAKMKASGQYEHAIIFITGDHGEEFLEHGRMIHGGETCRVQTHVPFYLKLPKDSAWPAGDAATLPTASHLDFFPTLLDYLGICVDGLCDGESLFRKRHDTVMIAAQNGGRDPFEFCLQTGERKAWFEYREEGNSIAFESTIYLQKLTDAQDRIIEMSPSEQRRLVRKFFGAGLRRIYPNIELDP